MNKDEETFKNGPKNFQPETIMQYEQLKEKLGIPNKAQDARILLNVGYQDILSCNKLEGIKTGWYKTLPVYNLYEPYSTPTIPIVSYAMVRQNGKYLEVMYNNTTFCLETHIEYTWIADNNKIYLCNPPYSTEMTANDIQIIRKHGYNAIWKKT